MCCYTRYLGTKVLKSSWLLCWLIYSCCGLVLVPTFDLKGRECCVVGLCSELDGPFWYHIFIYMSPLTSTGQRSRASCASQPQKSATLSPQPGGKTTKFIRTDGGIGRRKERKKEKKKDDLWCRWPTNVTEYPTCHVWCDLWCGRRWTVPVVMIWAVRRGKTLVLWLHLEFVVWWGFFCLSSRFWRVHGLKILYPRQAVWREIIFHTRTRGHMIV